LVRNYSMSKISIEIDDELVQKARDLTGLRTEQEIVSSALELLVRTESRKGILRYYGSGIWKDDVKKMRRNR
jgi:Arc/MetJ family transcription regulator